jgi:dCTP deaminase
MATENKMIEPFVETQTKTRQDGSRVISYGLSSYGYDLRVSREFKVFTNVFNTVVDPKCFEARSMVDMETDVCIVPPNSFALARSVEYFRIPRTCHLVGKSTARCGIITIRRSNLNEGHVTQRFQHHAASARLRGRGWRRWSFLAADVLARYADRAGKYMKQTGITIPRM